MQGTHGMSALVLATARALGPLLRAHPVEGLTALALEEVAEVATLLAWGVHRCRAEGCEYSEEEEKAMFKGVNHRQIGRWRQRPYQTDTVVDITTPDDVDMGPEWTDALVCMLVGLHQLASDWRVGIACDDEDEEKDEEKDSVEELVEMFCDDVCKLLVSCD